MRLATFVLAAAAALALAAPATAKEPTKAEVCGPAGCIAVTDKDTLRTFPSGDESLAAQPAPQAFHTVRYTVTEGEGGPEHTWTAYYIDREAMMAWRNDGGTVVWSFVRGDGATLIKKLARQVESFPAPAISGVTVGGRPVPGDAESYLALFDVTGDRLSVNALPRDWVPIDFRSARPSPWTDAPFELMYSPSTNALERGIDQLVLPSGIASDVEAARPLLASEGGWLPWLVVGALVATLLLLAGLGALLRNRLRTPPALEPAA
jgi:hypothetical protein